MIKVTVTNVTRMSEDALYLALAELTERDNMYHIIEAELDRRAEWSQIQLKKRQAAQIESLKLTQAIQSEIHALFEGYKGKKTLVLIEHLGQEFIEDYTICEETFTVRSLVAQNFSLNSNSTWEFDSIVKARQKMANLIYDRIYTKFMREPTNDNLELLKRVIGG